MARSILGAYGVAANAPIASIGPGAYADVVKAVATLLRPRFESGELRGLTNDDAERTSPLAKRKFVPPLWRIEKECSRLFIRSPEAALLVLRFGSSRANGGGGLTWTWDEVSYCSLSGVAAGIMARDVVVYARSKRWYTPAADEDPAPTRAELRNAA
jgi:hypothetical protein